MVDFNKMLETSRARKARMLTRAREVAAELTGTAKNLRDAASDEEQNDRGFTDELDSLVFECTVCGWWCDESECNGDNVCDDCTKAEDNDDGDDD